jgi:hypothetical protein
MMTSILGLDRRVHNLPEDLRQSVGESVLLKLALDAAQTVATEKQWLSGPGETQPGSHMLLALLTYCYAAGIYGSHDIESACHSDPVVRSICTDIRPGWPAIWRFRNANRPWIEECLARVYGAASGVRPTGVSHEPTPVPEFRGEALPDIIGIVRRKLRHAIWSDAAMYD